ncbi:FtsX-like permease family protein [Aliifodinibius sp. S!AR15-10]|uniref:ABC transporter permease n=1 Tax=Aliifodinibius sp. S!AR15-10 TaxID=2950437 RepID=UPI00285675D8|nr:FtsX-like permease family protein [Aliifodinibius sp. S!AR15-10]MDR8394467.1 FtsX-like permease family protein [Aliifodinibius sp. S!AR15-10]
MLAFKLAWRNIWRNKRRTLITLASIIVAVSLSAILRSSQEGQYDNMIESTVGTFTGYIQMHANGYWEEQTLNNSFSLTDSLKEQINDVESVTTIAPRIESYALAAAGNQSRPAMVMGIDVEAERQLSNPRERLQQGTYFDSNDEQAAIIGYELMQRLDAQLGDSLVLIGQGYRGMNATGLYPVKGTVSYPNPQLNSSLVLLPLETAQNFFVAPGQITTAALILDDAGTVNQSVEKLRSQLPSDQYEVMSWEELMPELQQAIQADRGSGMIILLVLYMLVGFGILGTVLMMVTERTYEFGVMLSVGTPRSMILKILACEVFIISMLGSLVGIIVSLPVTWYFNVNPIRLSGDMESALQQYAMEPILQFSVAPDIFIDQAIIVFIITLLFSLIPVIKATRLEPVEAMRG